jgi:hypothetical protein
MNCWQNIAIEILQKIEKGCMGLVYVLLLVEAIIEQQRINSAKYLNGLKESFFDFLNF